MRGWLGLLAGLMLLVGCEQPGNPTKPTPTSSDKGEQTLQFWTGIQTVEQELLAKNKALSAGENQPANSSPSDRFQQMADIQKEGSTRLTALNPAGVDEELVAQRDKLAQSHQTLHEGLTLMASMSQQPNVAQMQAQQNSNLEAIKHHSELIKSLTPLADTLKQKYNREFPVFQSGAP